MNARIYIYEHIKIYIFIFKKIRKAHYVIINIDQQDIYVLFVLFAQLIKQR